MNEKPFGIGEAVQLKGQADGRGVAVAGPREGSDGPSYEVFFGP